ncbi:hypothetical protein P7C70_g5098, partial [Phenoliferia sp. Uapishka_3]
MFASLPTPIFAVMATFSLLSSAAGTSLIPFAFSLNFELTILAALPSRGSPSDLTRRSRSSRPRRNVAEESLSINAVNPNTGKSHSVVVNGGGIQGSTINVNFNGRRDTSSPANSASSDASGDDATSTGDHSILIDASAPKGNGGGIRNSTINLTVISRRSAELVNSLALFIRSLVTSDHSYHDLSARIAIEVQQPTQRLRRNPAFNPENAPRHHLSRRIVSVDSPLAPASASASRPSISAASPSTVATPNATLATPVFPTKSLLPITLTLTLVPGPSGAYVDQAGLPSSASAPVVSSSSASASTTSTSTIVEIQTLTVEATNAASSPSSFPTAIATGRFVKRRIPRRSSPIAHSVEYIEFADKS